ncbi:MAG TPA: hypothetical protein ENI31_03960 [Candidatus Omnitrophica bacterium]|nr:MAG: hypothetical protein DRP69_02740 [Candidatus Omnitrophota bacterium]RKY43371.1 MAG: hypothetical protein DRP80_05395 [Candidatus Omnitrophota bacterium]HEC69421.1 hypothetical protein [Candidatus Omnitrophota bacterium]
MSKCKLCHKESRFVSQHLGFCLNCIREDFPKVKPFILEVHKKSARSLTFLYNLLKLKKGFLADSV